MNPEHLQQCLVCGQPKPQLFSFALCNHKFCLQCCQAFVQQKTASFQHIRCMHQGCNQPLDKKTVVYMKLPVNIKQKIQKLERLIFLQKNTHLKECSTPDCIGLININLKKPKQPLKCDNGEHQHCSKCYQAFHQGQCNLQIDNQMRKLNFKKCPKCSIWVEKTQGCNYISCKCGTAFCFTCGIEFNKDPCRKKEIWQEQQETRNYLRKIKIKKPESILGWIVFLPKTIIQILIGVILTVIFSIFPVVFGISVVLCLGLFVCPLGLCFCASEPEFQRFKHLIRFLVFLFYPLLMGCCGIVALLGCLLYPILRNTYHHGVYDPLDKTVVVVSNFMLYLLVGVFKC